MSKSTKHFFLILMLVCILAGNQTVCAQTKSNPGIPGLEYSDFVSDEPQMNGGYIEQRLKPTNYIKKILAMKGFSFNGITQKRINVCNYFEDEGDFFPVNPRQIIVNDSTYVRDNNGDRISVTKQSYAGPGVDYKGKEYYLKDSANSELDRRYVIEFTNPEDAIAFDKLFLNNYFQEFDGTIWGGPKEYKGEKVDSYLSLPEIGSQYPGSKSHFRDNWVFFVIGRIKDKIRILSMVSYGD